MELTIDDLRSLLGDRGAGGLGFKPGETVFIRTITFHYTGTVIDVADGSVTLRDASWIASSGRFAQFLQTGDADEVEPYPNQVAIALHAVVDWCAIPKSPREQC